MGFPQHGRIPSWRTGPRNPPSPLYSPCFSGSCFIPHFSPPDPCVFFLCSSTWPWLQQRQRRFQRLFLTSREMLLTIFLLEVPDHHIFNLVWSRDSLFGTVVNVKRQQRLQLFFCFGDDPHRRDARHSHPCEDRRDAETAH